MAMPSTDYNPDGAVNCKPLEDVITGAKHCISGKYCDARCPYWSKKRGRCVGDYRKDLLRWVIYLRNRDRHYCDLRPTAGDRENLS